MSEGKLNIEELSRRIDQLLNVLNMISKDLAEISKSLKAVGTLTAAPAVPIPVAPKEGMRNVEDVRVLFPSDLEEMLTFEESGDYIVIRPRRFLGSDNFAKIASIVRGVGGEYISAGKQSHFKVPREME
ncbi:MAG: hypothetical protein AOA66_0001 [Candidatus Bathyarchaeota archaeon BA2]|nr:MAG: hypothetical protein AOA66_0001 [Candidatus Bathyarchaeota archaeon BA2]